MAETTEILDFLSESACKSTEPHMPSTEMLDRIGELVHEHGKGEIASAAPATGGEPDKQKHAHGEAYLTGSEWEALRNIGISPANKVQTSTNIHT